MRKVKKTFKLIKRIFIGILAVLFFAFVIAMTTLLLNRNKYGITQFGENSIIFINRALTTNKYKKGDLLIVTKKNLSTIKVGDELFVYQVDKVGNVAIDVGPVLEKDDSQMSVKLENGTTYSSEYIIGQTTSKYSNAGTVLSIIESKWGFLFIVLVPCLLIFIYEVYSLIMAIKYGDEDIDD